MARELDELEDRFRQVAPRGYDGSLRYLEEVSETLSVRQDVLQPVRSVIDGGAMITLCRAGHSGYAATSDLTARGLARAAERAREWAERSRASGGAAPVMPPPSTARGEYEGPVERPWADVPITEKLDLLRAACGRLRTDERVVDWRASVGWTGARSLFVNTHGARIRQRFSYVFPVLAVTANEGARTQTRTLGGYGLGRQGGFEVLVSTGLDREGPRVAAEAVQLLDAPDCPTGTMDLVLAPDQMILQIHESIGHPLELDRILGDERNYAGTSFVTPEMFGTYRYGSELLNVSFDPTRPEQIASYGFDDDGRPATRELVIENGRLVRPLGGASSQARSGLEGVANARACSWNRPPIDRMANLNLEPGDASLAEMIGAVERGAYMATNCSWSIDDSRNKFQFGCEYGRLIEGGELTTVVRNCNYRGVSGTFWRSLALVGSEETLEVMGTPHCGKGEPNQMVRVGHASPACLFRDVDVFGGA